MKKKGSIDVNTKREVTITTMLDCAPFPEGIPHIVVCVDFDDALAPEEIEFRLDEILDEASQFLDDGHSGPAVARLLAQYAERLTDE